MRQERWKFFLFLICLVYVSLSLPILDLPGVHEEESYLVMNSASIVLEGEPFGVTTEFFGINVPIMMNEHIGVISTFSYALPFYLFGVNVITMRLTRIFIGLICIILTYWFVDLYFNKKVALLTAFLMSNLPFYIFFFRQGYLDDGFNLLLMLIFFILLSYFNKTHRSIFLNLSFLALGLGVSNKLNFIWLIIGVIVTFFILRPRIDLKKIRIKNIFIATIFLIAGASPIIYYNLAPYLKNEYGNNTIEEIAARVVYPRYGGNNLQILYNVIIRLDHIKIIFNNDFQDILPINNFFYFILFCIIFFYNVFDFKKSYPLRFFSILVVVIFFQSLFTITMLRIEHYVIFLPLFFSLFSYGLFNILQKKKFVFFSLIILITLFNILTLYATYEELNKKGAILPQQYAGWFFPSDSIYKLVDYLSSEEIAPIAIGAGLSTNIEFLSNFNISVKKCEYTIPLRECIDWDFSKVYIMKTHANEEYWIPFKEAIYKNNKSIRLDKVFYARDKSPEIVVFYLSNKTNNTDIEKIELYFEEVNR